MSAQMGKQSDIPISTAELIAALKQGRVSSEGVLTVESLEAMEIVLGSSPQFAIAVLIKVLRQRDQEIERLAALTRRKE